MYDSNYFELVEMNALTDQKAGFSALTIRVNPLIKAILQAEALFRQKSVGALVREWIDERLDLPTG